MDIKISKTYDFIPIWNGNKEDKKPIVFHLKYLTTEQIDRCIEVGSTVSINRRQYLRESWGSVENLSIEGKPICTADEFLKAIGISGLFTEVTTEILERNNREPGKN